MSDKDGIFSIRLNGIPTLEKFQGRLVVNSSANLLFSKSTKAQSIIITGNIGVGKTSLGRLIALEYLNMQPEAISHIGAISYYTELNLHSQKSEDNLDRFINEISKESRDDKWRVFLLDECHLLTIDAQKKLAESLNNSAKNTTVIVCTMTDSYLDDYFLDSFQMSIKVDAPVKDKLCTFIRDICRRDNIEYDNDGIICIINSCKHHTVRYAIDTLNDIVGKAGSATLEAVAKVLYKQ